MTETEAIKMKHETEVLVVEEDSYVYGSSDSQSDLDDFYQKQVLEKNIEERSAKNSDVEWNIQAIKADNIDLEIATSPSATINVATGPAISINVATGSAISTNKVKVALIDSGIDYTSDIDVFKRKNFIPDEDGVSIIYEDSCGHGTSVAGIIAAKDNDEGITGINPNVELYSARVLDSNLSAPVSRVIEAIYWAIDNNVNIINISFGTTKNSTALKTAIQDAYNAGILIVAAAGNNGTVEYPAAYDEVIAVGSVNPRGVRSEGSATGDGLELMAPGEQILSTGDFGGLSVSSGTSMATPHVVGVASILWQKDLSVSNRFIRSLLDISANLYGDSTEYGYGLIDLNYALELYDTFKVTYDENLPLSNIIENAQENGVLLDNTSEVITFEDVDYVVGSWESTPHKNLVEEPSYESGNQLSQNAIKVVKLGAIASDKIVPGFTTYPQFHGFMSKKNGNTTIYKSNYIASYIYLTNKAVALHYNTSPVVPSYLSSNDRNGIDSYLTTSGFNGRSWSTLLEGNTVNATNKALFVYGLALHSVSDIFAHCTWDTEFNEYIDHDNGADAIHNLPNRYACAQLMAQKLVAHIKDHESGELSDFYTVAAEIYDTSFKLGRLSEYAKAVNSNYYNSNKYVFDAMNINK